MEAVFAPSFFLATVSLNTNAKHEQVTFSFLSSLFNSSRGILSEADFQSVNLPK
jgi:hypothetical protein